jgi:hypothetical protein
MDRNPWSREQNDRWENDRCLEMESELQSIRGLVCELLKKNEDLRQALHEADATRQSDE